MRYFKYDPPTPPETEEQKKQNVALLKETAKVHRRDKIMTVLAWTVIAVVFLALFVLGQWANGRITEGIFDLLGRRIKDITAPGLYIVNGKKVLVK